MVGSAVLLGDAEVGEFVFERVAASFAGGVACGEDHPVVGEGRRGRPINADCSTESVEDVDSVDPGVGGHGDGKPGAVIEKGGSRCRCRQLEASG